MRTSVLSDQSSHQAENARHLQAQLYREIGISAVAAALQCINQPKPTKLSTDANPESRLLRRDDIAA